MSLQVQGKAETMKPKVGKRKRKEEHGGLVSSLGSLEGFWVFERTLMFPKVNSQVGYGGDYDTKRANILIFSSLGISSPFLGSLFSLTQETFSALWNNHS